MYQIPKTLYTHRPLPKKPESPGPMKIKPGRVRYTHPFNLLLFKIFAAWRGKKSAECVSLRAAIRRKGGEKKECRDFSQAPLHAAFRKKKGRERGFTEINSHAASKSKKKGREKKSATTSVKRCFTQLLEEKGGRKKSAATSVKRRFTQLLEEKGERKGISGD